MGSGFGVLFGRCRRLDGLELVGISGFGARV